MVTPKASVVLFLNLTVTTKHRWLYPAQIQDLRLRRGLLQLDAGMVWLQEGRGDTAMWHWKDSATSRSIFYVFWCLVFTTLIWYVYMIICLICDDFS
jgi:ABC-type multidrug transport system permease subunit